MKKLIYLFVLVMLVSGCTTIYGKDWNRTFFATDLAKVSVAENRDSVVKKLGRKYIPVALEMKEGHKFEVLEFNEQPGWAGRVNKAYWTPYWVYFMDDKLVKYERATGQELLERTKWMQEVYGMAMTMDAFKGTALMPYQQNVNVKGNVKGNVNVQGNIHHDVDIH